jgi:aminocarboxymuconate-semialdehyde decarboxylase
MPTSRLKKPTEYLDQLHFDAPVFTPEALRHLVAQVGASQVVLGSDHQHPVDHSVRDHRVER